MPTKTDIGKHIKSSNNYLNTSVGRIENLTLIGQGANGMVYSGRILQHEVAIKILTNIESSEKLLRFQAEYVNLSMIEASPDIVRLITYGELEIAGKAFPYILMRKYISSLVRPGTNEEIENKFPHIFRFLVRVLGFIHSRGIIHRDLKPQNILCSGDNSYVLADFGIAYYNPEMFSLKYETKQGDRLGNYYFSAPEQSDSTMVPHPNMDIYALGQLCQWYLTGSTHRGTHRESVQRIFPHLGLYDSVIEKCLSNNPIERYQRVEELEEYLEASTERPYGFYLDEFGDALAQTFPKQLGELIFINEKPLIDKLFHNLSMRDFGDNLWWSDGMGNLPANFKKDKDDIWLLGSSNVYHELRLNSIVVFFDIRLYNDLILINTDPMPPFGIYEEHGDYEEAGFVDNEFYVTRNEYDNGYAIKGDDTIRLAEHSISLRIRHLRKKSFVIATRFHCALQRGNDKRTQALIEQLEAGRDIPRKDFDDYVDEIRDVLHPKVEMHL